MQFLLLPLGTGGQKLSARCQPHSQTYQLVTGMKGFIPPDTHLAGESAAGRIPSCFRAASCHVWGPVTADRCQGLVDSTNPVCAEQVGAGKEA